MSTTTDSAHVSDHHAESAHLAVLLNGAPQLLVAPTIAAALSALALPADAGHIAIAINETVVARTRWEEITLRANDRIEVITAVAGG